MKQISTAEEFIDKNYNGHNNGGKPHKITESGFIHYSDIPFLMIEFAQLHVKAALEAASKNAEISTIIYSNNNYTQSELENKLAMSDWTYGTRDENTNELIEVSVAIVSQESILTAYPLSNIK